MAKTNGRRIRKILLPFFVIIGFLLSFFGLKAFNFHPDLTAELSTEIIQTDFSKITVPQGSFTLFVNNRVIHEQSGDKVFSTASTAKMILALAVMEKRPFGLDSDGASLVLGRDDYEFYRYHLNNGGSRTQVEVGEKITQKEALQALLIKSSNNMADSLAVWAFGNLAEYRDYAHKMLIGWGLQDTTIGDDASGLSPTTTSTSHDLAVVGSKILNNPVLASIVKQAEAEIPVAGKISNTNYLLARDTTIVGIKSGFIDEGRVFVLGAKNGEDMIVVSVMGVDKKGDAIGTAYGLYQEAVTLAKAQKIVEKGDAVGSLQPEWLDGLVEIYADEDLVADIWNQEGMELTLDLDDNILGKTGRVGELKLTAPNLRKTIPVSVKTPILEPDLLFRIFN